MKKISKYVRKSNQKGDVSSCQNGPMGNTLTAEEEMLVTQYVNYILTNFFIFWVNL